MASAFSLIIAILLLAAFAAWLAQFLRTPEGRDVLVRISTRLRRAIDNPLLAPMPHHDWESEAVFNPAAIVLDGRIHLLYRAIGADGISRLGYASSADGIRFDERLPYPVFQVESPREIERKRLGKKRRYDPVQYPSGGSWGGCEDPRLVSIEDHIYLTFNAFDGWDYIRVAAVSLPAAEFARKWWAWSRPLLLSPKGQVHKNWVLFPEKIGGRYAILHSVTPEIQIDYADRLEDIDAEVQKIESRFSKKRRAAWDSYLRGAGAPPVKTPEGWLVLYHAISENEPDRYKIGAMLLDLKDPTNVIARSAGPLLSPDMPYENHWKPGIVYTCGAVVKDGDFFLYYGGGDRHVCVAHAPLSQILSDLKHDRAPTLSATDAVMA